jgi:class 3 adenylate cyclase/YHS domain-containing protein
VTGVERTIAFVLADLAGYVALTEAHGNVGAAAVIERFVDLTRGALAPGARLVERVGDQVVVAADDLDAALDTALQLAATAAGEPRFPPIRVGVHAGLVLVRDDTYFGAALNIAARVVAHAQPGQILCTSTVTAGGRDRAGLTLQPLGPVTLRHVLEPVELFELMTAPAPPAVVDPVCFMRVAPADAVARAQWGDTTYFFCSESCAAAFAVRPDAYARALAADRRSR